MQTSMLLSHLTQQRLLLFGDQTTVKAMLKHACQLVYDTPEA